MSGTINVQKKYKAGRVVLDETTDEELIEVSRFPEGVPVAHVTAGGRLTINMDNFESTQIGAEVTLPCVMEELEDAYETAKAFVDAKLNKEAKLLKDYRKEVRGKK